MKKLNIGCGPTKLDGYDNLDNNLKWEPDILADARDLPSDDNAYDLVQSYGFIEHIEPDDIQQVINEMYRVLKPGGEVRIGTEDLHFHVKRYMEGSGIDGWVLSAVYGPHYSHKMLFDSHSLMKYMEKAGFGDIRVLNYNDYGKTYNFSYGILYMVGSK